MRRTFDTVLPTGMQSPAIRARQAAPESMLLVPAFRNPATCLRRGSPPFQLPDTGFELMQALGRVLSACIIARPEAAHFAFAGDAVHSTLVGNAGFPGGAA
jgi:hypothetical protein